MKKIIHDYWKLPVKLQEYEILFNNTRSSQYYLYLTEYPSIPQLNEEHEEVEVEGRNGSLIINKGTYKNRNISMKFRVVSRRYFYENIDNIVKWFKSTKDNRLFYERTDRCFRVKKVILGNIEKEARKTGIFEVEFIVEPFIEDISKFATTFTEKEKFIYCESDFKTDSKITIKGNGNIQITLNDETCEIKNVTNGVVIDSKLFECIDFQGKDKVAEDMIGDFPQFEPGDNKIILNGNVTETNIEFSNYYR